ncbi:hypothetical protein [Cysteiniphilum sp. QT6929]|uniref:hypothetical protein n=1 Tax=Cysteiniphilum sp. QT6929 TaxID=2975055 RepID=UPI0024B320CB|nr:hypothetical protein [Cysteiniphilum sp. QT6929]WHN66756.1 hypothetical protein NYP54_11775 [Cysteiniphilum sp. QT6929]
MGKSILKTMLTTMLLVQLVLGSSIQVDIAFSGSFEHNAAAASLRYKQLYMDAIDYSVKYCNDKLRKHGYKINPVIHSYDETDTMGLINDIKSFKKYNVWLIMGARRSKAILVATKIAPDIPILSSLANAPDIYDSKYFIFSAYPPAEQFAHAMYQEIKKQHIGNSYGIFVDIRCLSCKKFADTIVKLNNENKPKFYLNFAENTPDTDDLIHIIKKTPIDYLILPNYSHDSGIVISRLSKIFPSLYFIGNDSWGEINFSYLQGYDIHQNNVNAIAIRATFISDDLEKKPIVKNFIEYSKLTTQPPASIINMILMIDKISDDLIESKPQTRKAFINMLKQQAKTHFYTAQPYAIFHWTKGQLDFKNYVNK